MMKLPVLCIAVASAVISTTYLSIAEIPVHQSSANNKTNLNKVSIVYDTTVSHMNQITLQEANNIINGVKQAITNKLDTLNCQEDIDYTISGLDTIHNNQDLNAVTITVNSTDTSEKITGSTTILINVKEDISNRKINPPISVPQSQQNNLSDITATIIKNNIIFKVNEIVSASQQNKLNIDYTINNLDEIKEGAAFNNFKNIVSVNSIITSKTLTGNFTVNFELDPNN